LKAAVRKLKIIIIYIYNYTYYTDINIELKETDMKTLIFDLFTTFY